MSGIEARVTNLEEQVGGIRESVAIIQTEQKHTMSSLVRIEERLDEISQSSLLSLTGAIRNPQTIVIILTILGGLLGNNAMLAMADTMGQANASETVDVVNE